MDTTTDYGCLFKRMVKCFANSEQSIYRSNFAFFYIRLHLYLDEIVTCDVFDIAFVSFWRPFVIEYILSCLPSTWRRTKSQWFKRCLTRKIKEKVAEDLTSKDELRSNKHVSKVIWSENSTHKEDIQSVSHEPDSISTENVQEMQETVIEVFGERALYWQKSYLWN